MDVDEVKAILDRAREKLASVVADDRSDLESQIRRVEAAQQSADPDDLEDALAELEDLLLFLEEE